MSDIIHEIEVPDEFRVNDLVCPKLITIEKRSVKTEGGKGLFYSYSDYKKIGFAGATRINPTAIIAFGYDDSEVIKAGPRLFSEKCSISFCTERANVEALNEFARSVFEKVKKSFELFLFNNVVVSEMLTKEQQQTIHDNLQKKREETEKQKGNYLTPVEKLIKENKEILLSTAETLIGYEVTEYIELVSGTDIYLVGGLIGGGFATQEGLFEKAMRNAEKSLRSKAKSFGANAVIGIRQSFTAPGATNHMILALTGTAVKIKKNEKNQSSGEGDGVLV